MECGETDKHPRAFVYNESGAQLTVLDMGHVANGLYKPSSPYFMPSNEFIEVVYVVYDDIGHSTLSDDQGRDRDVFLRETVHEITWDELLSDHTITGSAGQVLALVESLDPDSLLSKLVDCELTAVLESDDLAAVVVESEEDIQVLIDEELPLVAMIDIEETLNTNLETENYIGVVNEC